MDDSSADNQQQKKAFDHKKVLTAIDRTIGVFEEMGLTVAETVHVAAVINESVKASCPEVYELMAGGVPVRMEEDED